MAEEEEKKEGVFSKIMGFLKYIAGIVHEIFKAKGRVAEQKNRKEVIKNENAKKEVENRNEAEDLVSAMKDAKTPEEREAILNEIRKKLAK